MKYPDDFESIVGFDQIRASIVGRLKYPSTHELAKNWSMQTEWEKVIQPWDLMDQISQLHVTNPSVFQLLGGDISEDIQHLNIENFYLEIGRAHV